MRFYTRFKNASVGIGFDLCLIALELAAFGRLCLNAALTKRQHNYLSMLLGRFCVSF
jgi:hypothetical protein